MAIKLKKKKPEQPVDLYDTTSLPHRQQQYSEVNEDPRMKISNRRALAAGATPLLIGLMTGNMGDAAEIASKGLIQEDQRKQKEEQTLLSYLRKKESTSSGGKNRFVPTSIYNNGESYVGAFDRSTGTVSPTKYQKSYSTKEYKDAEGRHVRSGIKRGDNATVIQTEGDYNKSSLITPRFKNRSDKIADKYISDMRPYKDAHQSMIEAKSLLADPKSGVFGSKVAVANLIKKVEKGKMSDEDRSYYVGALSIINGMLESVEKQVTGKEKRRLIKEVNASLDDLIKQSNNKIIGEARTRSMNLSDNKEQEKYLLNKLKSGQYLSPVPEQNQSSDSVDEKVDRMSDKEVTKMLKELKGGK